MSTTRQVARIEPAAVPTRPILEPQTFDQLVKFSEMAANSGMVPKSYEGKVGSIMVAIQMGSELGLSPIQSLLSIAVINGRPGVWGDGLIGLCRQSPLCQDIVETIEGEGDARTAICVATRRGASPVTGRFSVADAKKAGLWGKNVWAAYPDRMLQNRARGFALRDAFPDLLRGLKTVEELRDTPRDDFQGTTLNARAELPRASTSEAIGDDIPDRVMQPKKRTAEDLLLELRPTFDACHTEQEVDALVHDERVVWATNNWKKGSPALNELNAMMAEAMERVKADDGSDAAEPVPDDDGDRP